MIARAVQFLRQKQQPDGSFFGRWGVNYLYGAGAVLPGLQAIHYDLSEPWIQRALAWVADHQNADGGFGEDPSSYRDRKLAGKAPSVPSQTAWALMALLAGGAGESKAAERAAFYLIREQTPTGGWDETRYTGTGFPGDFYINYQLYRDVFPLLALSRYQKISEARRSAQSTGNLKV